MEEFLYLNRGIDGPRMRWKKTKSQREGGNSSVGLSKRARERHLREMAIRMVIERDQWWRLSRRWQLREMEMAAFRLIRGGEDEGRHLNAFEKGIEEWETMRRIFSMP